MTAHGAIAFGYARIRAWRSRLLTREDAAPLFAARDERAARRALAALKIEEPLARLLAIYRTALRGYPHGAPLFRALLGLHEIENVKLLWRVAGTGRYHDRIPRLWIDLGELASLRIANFTDVTTIAHLAVQLARTPYAAVAETIARVHERDVAAAELAFDRWSTERLRDAAMRLRRREPLAHKLIASVAEERDAQLAVRGARWFGLASLEPAAVDIAALREERARLCRRAIRGDPFSLAVPLAVILLAEAEVRAVRALVERGSGEGLEEALARALAGSRIGT